MRDTRPGRCPAWALTFDGDKVVVNFENIDGLKVELHGEKAD